MGLLLALQQHPTLFYYRQQSAYGSLLLLLLEEEGEELVIFFQFVNDYSEFLFVQIFSYNSLSHALLGRSHIEEVVDDLECYSYVTHALCEYLY